MNGDGRVDNRDVQVSGSGAGNAFVKLDTANGIVTITGTTGTYLLEYWMDQATDVVVTAKSNGDPTGIDLTLGETGPSTGVFGAGLTICDSDVCDSNENAGTLAVDTAGDTIVVEYSDDDPSGTRRESIPLDVSRPSFSGFSPVSGTSGTDDDPNFSVEVRDGESQIVDDDDATESLQFIFALYIPDAAAQFSGPLAVERGGSSFEESAVSNGFAIEATFSNGRGANQLDPDGEDEYEIHWWVMARDQSGNMAISDAVPAVSLDGRVTVAEGSNTVYSSKELVEELSAGDTITIAGESRIVTATNPDATEPYVTVDGAFNRETQGGLATRGDCIPGSFDSNNLTRLAGCESHVVRVDESEPELGDATAGNWLDGDKIKSGPDAIRTSIQVGFNENIDCDSVSAEDFEVDGAVPNSADCLDNMVFLSVDALDPDDEPNVEIVGGIADTAGNVLDEGDVDADDGMPAGLTITIEGTAEGDRPVTDSIITIGISSDERLGDRPAVVISQVHDAYMNSGESVTGTASPTGATNEWEFSVSLSDAGLYNVYITGMDLGAGIETSEGVAGPDFDSKSLDDDNPMVFEVDTEVAAPTYTPADEGSTDNVNVFLKVDFATEANEYGLDADGEATDNAADVDTDFDNHNTVALTSATLDGPGYDDMDVMDMFSTRDNVLFIWRPGDLGLGTYTLTVEAEDVAGNENESSATFDVTARQAYSLPLEAGSNLVSLPSNPEDGDINAVFGGESAITTVMTYDNASGLWQIANRDGAGMLVGNLTNIDARHAYWVIANQSLDLKVLLPASGGLTVFPPAIEVYEGWNLVPVASVEQAKAGSAISANTYFGNIEWSIGYGYDPVLGGYEKKVKFDGDNLPEFAVGDAAQYYLQTGQGYFVYADSNGVIIP